jgi:Amt family ammonium transporter
LRDWPDGLLAIGDAFVSFNPVFAQGITVAACVALVLRDALSAGRLASSAFVATHFGAAAAAIGWAMAEWWRAGKPSALGMISGAVAGLVAITPASGFVGVMGASVLGFAGGVGCFLAVTRFKRATGIDDSLDVFALHGVGGIIGTVLTPVFALKEIAPVTATVMTNLMGACAVAVYAGVATWLILLVVKPLAGLRVTAAEEELGLDLAQHGEMISGA